MSKLVLFFASTRVLLFVTGDGTLLIVFHHGFVEFLAEFAAGVEFLVREEEEDHDEAGN